LLKRVKPSTEYIRWTSTRYCRANLHHIRILLHAKQTCLKYDSWIFYYYDPIQTWAMIKMKQTSKRRTDSQLEDFNNDRLPFIHLDRNGFYFSTREGVSIGPFATHEEAINMRSLFKYRIRIGKESPMAVIHSFNTQNRKEIA
jgi:hypothetical protein